VTQLWRCRPGDVTLETVMATGEVVVIELGTAHGAVDDDAPAPRTHRRRETRARLGVIAAVLALLCAGAAPARSALRHAATLHPSPAASVSVAGDLLVVADPTGGPDTTVTAYGLPDSAAQWTATLPGSAVYTASAADGLILLAERDALRRRAATIALDAGTGAVRWRTGGAVITSPGAPVGLVVNEVRSFSGPGRRVQGGIEAVDLATGTTRWRVQVPSTAVAEVSARPAVALVVYDSSTAEVRDLATGTVRASMKLPPTDYAPDNPQMIGGTLVLRHRERDRPVVTGYELTTLGLRWSRLDRAAGLDWTDCPPRLCARRPTETWTLDPADGSWTTTPGDGVIWRSMRGSGDRLVARSLDGDRLLVAATTPDQPRPIGALPAGYRDCRAGASALVCRLDSGGLAVVAMPRGTP
jgi:hypothetical protein